MTNTNYPSATPQDSKPKSNSNKNILIGILAAGLLGTWGYLLYDKNKTNESLGQKDNKIASVTNQFDSLKFAYDDAVLRLDSLTGDNNLKEGQLSEKQKEINNLKGQIRSVLSKKNATEADLKKAKSLIAELNEKINSYEVEIAKLTAENQQLTADNEQLSSEKMVLTENLTTATTQNKELSSTVDVGSTFSASNIQITPVNERKNGKEKTTTTAKKVDKLVVSFDVENRIAKSGPADIYVMVTNPEGKVIADESMGSGTLTTRNDGERTFTSKLSINYDQGTRKNLQIPIHWSEFKTGDYKIEVYHNGFKIGEGVRTLKKGGIFG
ncbi:MAG: hypothetical protein GC171_06915 [Terrimonas sp.]|nr:hypothetical protein [Terrimonas sp.]